jgi:hypothetical protein
MALILHIELGAHISSAVFHSQIFGDLPFVTDFLLVDTEVEAFSQEVRFSRTTVMQVLNHLNRLSVYDDPTRRGIVCAGLFMASVEGYSTLLGDDLTGQNSTLFTDLFKQE